MLPQFADPGIERVTVTDMHQSERGACRLGARRLSGLRLPVGSYPQPLPT